MNYSRESCRKLTLKAVLVAEFKNKHGGEQEEARVGLFSGGGGHKAIKFCVNHS